MVITLIAGICCARYITNTNVKFVLVVDGFIAKEDDVRLVSSLPFFSKCFSIQICLPQCWKYAGSFLVWDALVFTPCEHELKGKKYGQWGFQIVCLLTRYSSKCTEHMWRPSQTHSIRLIRCVPWYRQLTCDLR